MALTFDTSNVSVTGALLTLDVSGDLKEDYEYVDVAVNGQVIDRCADDFQEDCVPTRCFGALDVTLFARSGIVIVSLILSAGIEAHPYFLTADASLLVTQSSTPYPTALPTSHPPSLRPSTALPTVTIAPTLSSLPTASPTSGIATFGGLRDALLYRTTIPVQSSIIFFDSALVLTGTRNDTPQPRQCDVGRSVEDVVISRLQCDADPRRCHCVERLGDVRRMPSSLEGEHRRIATYKNHQLQQRRLGWRLQSKSDRS